MILGSGPWSAAVELTDFGSSLLKEYSEYERNNDEYFFHWQGIRWRDGGCLHVVGQQLQAVMSDGRL